MSTHLGSISPDSANLTKNSIPPWVASKAAPGETGLGLGLELGLELELGSWLEFSSGISAATSGGIAAGISAGISTGTSARACAEILLKGFLFFIGFCSCSFMSVIFFRR